ncbi:group II intron reverse transcriptase/maturase [compost metagenome]
MYDHSFNKDTIRRELRKSDFFKNRAIHNEAERLKLINSALEIAFQYPKSTQLTSKETLKNKPINRSISLESQLLIRRTNRNIKRSRPIKTIDRDTIVANIKTLLSEGVPYRIYRLDIKAFYESFPETMIRETINNLPEVSSTTKGLLHRLLDENHSTYGTGLPRGLAVSATLSELLMKNFDKTISSREGVFFYARFVDDIVIITDCKENKKEFKKSISISLPGGLKLNQEKVQIKEANQRVKPFAPSKSTSEILSFEYLGYQFTVKEPLEIKGKKPGQHFRSVELDIAKSKIKKIKTRITLAIMDYCRKPDPALLKLRIKYLTCNFSIPDRDKNKRRLAGIYFNYKRINESTSSSLKELDEYLKKSITSSTGKIFLSFYTNSNKSLRSDLLRNSFTRGFNDKTFIYFSSEQLINIQKCWNYA